MLVLLCLGEIYKRFHLSALFNRAISIYVELGAR